MQIKDTITMTILEPRKTACLEFYSSPKNDVIADEFAFLLSNIPDGPEWDPFGVPYHKEKAANLFQIVESEFPQSVRHDNDIIVRMNGETIGSINLLTRQVHSRDLSMKLRYDSLMEFMND